MYVAKIGFCRTYQSTTSFPRASTRASDIGAAIAQGCLALSPVPSRGDPSTALVPAEMAEVLGPRELFPGEDRSVDAHELVVEGACIANPDPAADREDGLAVEAERVPVRPSDADPVSGGEGGQGMGRIPVVADGDALHRA